MACGGPAGEAGRGTLLPREQLGALLGIFGLAERTGVARFFQIDQLLADGGLDRTALAVADGGDATAEQKQGGRDEEQARKARGGFHDEGGCVVGVAIGGRVAIRSAEGKGSTFRMTLPLTLAVMEGMVFSVANETYIMPLANIVECLRLTPKDIQTAAMGGHFLVIRGEVIPLIYLWQFFSIANAKSANHEGVVVVIEVEGGTKAGVVVDEIRGQQQVVVKSIESNYGKIEGAAAATVLGDGQVALILDADAFGRLVSARGGGQRAVH